MAKRGKEHRFPRHPRGPGWAPAGDREAIPAGHPGDEDGGLLGQVLHNMPDPALKFYNYQALEIETICSP